MADDLLGLVGHQIDGEEEDSSDSEIDIGDNSDLEQRRSDPPSIPITFDPSLPGAHSYLGSDLEDLTGRTVHEDDSYQSLPLLSLPGVVLVPGQTLPLCLFHPVTVAMVRELVRGDKTFGLVMSRYQENDFDQCLGGIGTTAEIFSYKEDNDELSGIVTVRVKATGRQRFRLKEMRRRGDGIMMAKVQILSECDIGDSLEGARPPSHLKLCLRNQGAALDNVDLSGDQSMPSPPVLQNRRLQKCRQNSAYLTWWPPWVYKQYDVYDVMQRVKMELQSWNETLKPETMPKDPTDFSFWVAGNIPLDDSLKLHLLKIDSAVQRLRCELSVIQRCAVLCCKECGLLIANKKDVFSMAVEGPMAAYVNPGGHVHETLTVYKAHGLSLIGRPSTEHSWFPGYAWTIAQCRHCSAHMGWRFNATKRKLQPDKFWGLGRSSLLPGLQNTEDEDKEAWVPTM